MRYTNGDMKKTWNSMKTSLKGWAMSTQGVWADDLYWTNLGEVPLCGPYNSHNKLRHIVSYR